MPGTSQFDAINPAISLAALHERMIVLAQDEQGHLTHVDAARRGKACHCRCLACGEALIARHGEVKAHSFAHESGAECQFAIDAMLNRLARELIAAHGSFRTPALTVKASRAGPIAMIQCEESIPSRNLEVESVSMALRVHSQRPSVVMRIKGRDLLLEVTHAHHLDARKRHAIEKLGVPAIELQVSGCTFESVAQFERLVVEATRHKHWIFNPKAGEIQARLEAMAQEQFVQQNIQHARRLEQQRREQAALAAARLAREREVESAFRERSRLQSLQDQQLRQHQAHLDSLAQAASEKPPAPHRQALRYRLQDGGLMIRHEPGSHVLIVPETGKEQALGVLLGLGLEYDAALGGYATDVAGLAEILPALAPQVLSVRSV